MDRVLVDQEEGTVRIMGRQKGDVDAARSRLELDAKSVALSSALWESSSGQVEALVERVRAKSKLALAELQADEQGLSVSGKEWPNYGE